MRRKSYPGAEDTCKSHPKAVPSGGSNVMAIAMTREDEYRRTAFSPV